MNKNGLLARVPAASKQSVQIWDVNLNLYCNAHCSECPVSKVKGPHVSLVFDDI